MDQNPTDPGAKGRPAFEPIQAFDHRNPGVLHDFFSDFSIGHIAQGHSNERAMLLSNQFIESPLLTRPESRDESALGLRKMG